MARKAPNWEGLHNDAVMVVQISNCYGTLHRNAWTPSHIVTPHYNDDAYTRPLSGSPQLWEVEAQKVEERDILERRILGTVFVVE